MSWTEQSLIVRLSAFDLKTLRDICIFILINVGTRKNKKHIVHSNLQIYFWTFFFYLVCVTLNVSKTKYIVYTFFLFFFASLLIITNIVAVTFMLWIKSDSPPQKRRLMQLTVPQQYAVLLVVCTQVHNVKKKRKEKGLAACFWESYLKKTNIHIYFFNLLGSVVPGSEDKKM